MLTANRVRSLLDAIHSNWDPFLEWSKLPVAPQAQPRVWKGEQGVVLEIDLPGCETQDIEVSTERNRLSIAMKSSGQEAADTGDYRIREREVRAGSFDFELPFPLREDLIDVVYRHGIVRVTIAKPQEEQRRTLNVRSA